MTVTPRSGGGGSVVIVARRPWSATACSAVAAPLGAAFTAAPTPWGPARAGRARARGPAAGRSSRARELHGESAGHAAGAVHKDPLPGGGWCDLGERLVRGECRHRARGGGVPGGGGRLRRDKRSRSDKRLRPRPLVSQRQRVSEHLVTRDEARHVLADC